MKKILCLICILSMLFTTTSCTLAQNFEIHYDDIMFYVTPVMEAKPGEMVQVRVNAKEGASFFLYVNDILMSPHAIDDKFITYEFIMPMYNVTITHIKEEEPELNEITLPASMTCHRISYETEFAFNSKYVIVTNEAEAAKLFAGFSLAHSDQVKPYPENFFNNHLIVAFLQHEGSGSISHSLKGVTIDGREVTINVTREVPSIGTCDMASWLCLVTISKRMLPEGFSLRIVTTNKEV